MKNSHKIIFSSNASWYLWNFRRNLTDAFSRDGYDVVATSSRDGYSERLSREIRLIEMKNLKRTGMNPLRDISLILEYVKTYRREKPGLVFNFTIKPNVYSSIACRILGIACVSTVTGLGYSFLKEGWLQKMTIMLYKIALAKNKFVVFQNADDLEWLVAKKIIPREKTVLIEGSGIDTNRFSPIPESVKNDSNVKFLLVARMLRDKGVVEFVEAARAVRRAPLAADFILLGPIDVLNPSSILFDEIDGWHREGIVRYLGETDDIVPHLHAADVIVLPSYREGLPKSLLEAMAAGKPVIATDIPGSRAVVIHGENGFLVPVKNADALADAMMRMIAAAAFGRRRMGERGRAMVMERFDEKIIIEHYKNLVREIIG